MLSFESVKAVLDFEAGEIARFKTAFRVLHSSKSFAGECMLLLSDQK